MTNGASRDGVHLLSDFLHASANFVGDHTWARIGAGILGYLLIDDITGGDNTLLSAGLAAVFALMAGTALDKTADLAAMGEDYLFNGPQPVFSM